MTDFIIYISISLLAITILLFNQKDYWEDHFKVILKPASEIFVCLLLIVLSYASIELHTLKKKEHIAFTIGSLDSQSIKQINIVDRSIAGRWDIEAKDNGKIVKNIAIYLIPFFLFLFKGSMKRKLILFFIFSQGYVLTESLTGITKGLVERFRPFAYMSVQGLEKLNAKEKEKFLEDIADYDILNSFFSGDASILAYGLIFFAFSFNLIYTNHIAKKTVWIFSVLGVIIGCYFRTLSGKHFPTDVIVGGLVGALVAIVIIKLHLNKNT